MKIVFFGTSDVGLPILKTLNEQHEVLHVITSPDRPVGRKQEMTSTPIATLATELNLPVSKPQTVKNNPEFLDQLRALNADIFIVVSYGKILPIDLLEIPELKTINVHFSLLPKYRGPAPIQFALLAGEDIIGTTIFILDELVDHGPVLAMEEMPISPDDTFATLAPKLADLSAGLLIRLLPDYAAGEIIPVTQDHSQATTTHLIKKEHGKIDWSKSATEIYNQWRAFTPWPGIWTTFENDTLRILECEPASPPETPNAFTDLKDVIPCGQDTFLRLIKIQLAGKSATSMQDFLNGRRNFTPASLGQ